MTEPSTAETASLSRIDAISTRVTLLEQAFRGPEVGRLPARQQLVLRYHKAIRSYLGALLRDDDKADDVAHAVVIRILRGDFAGWAPQAGKKFRYYLKTAVRNAALNFLREESRKARTYQDLVDLVETGTTDASADQEWDAACHRTLLDNALAGLRTFQEQTEKNIFATLANLLVEYPNDDSDQLAERLNTLVSGKRTFEPANVRQQIKRMRHKLAELLVAEIRAEQIDPTPESVEDQLIERGFMPYVGRFLPSDWRTRGELSNPE
jgi:RNA polymerase sigma factor (sigma-70 family)